MQAKLAVLNKLLTHYGKQNWWNHSNRLVDWVSMILIQQTTQLNVEEQLYQGIDGLVCIPWSFFGQICSYCHR